MSAETETITQAYRYALRLTREQEEKVLAFTGAARFAFNWGLALVKRRLDDRARGEEVYLPWSYHSLYTEWRAARDEVCPVASRRPPRAIGSRPQWIAR